MYTSMVPDSKVINLVVMFVTCIFVPKYILWISFFDEWPKINAIP